MSHIEGHIEEEFGSCGILKLNPDDENGLYFVPPTWSPKKNSRVGFHVLQIPVTSEDLERGYLLVAYDVVPWKRHLAAEMQFLSILEEKFSGQIDIPDNLELLDFEKKTIIEAALGMIHDCDTKEILKQAFRYLNSTSEGRRRGSKTESEFRLEVSLHQRNKVQMKAKKEALENNLLLV